MHEKVVVRMAKDKENLSKYYLELDKKWTAHNYKPIPVVIKKANGIWVWDVDGKKYMDCLSAYSSQNFGHLHPKLIKALKKQAKQVIVHLKEKQSKAKQIIYSINKN